MSTGYARFLEVKQAFKEKRPIPVPKDYSKIPHEELLVLKKTAEDWLMFHKNHPKYDEAVERLHAIERQITYLDCLEVFGGIPQNQQRTFSGFTKE